jgi:molybdopterin-guanine dinucleotide biosynthesis protein A
VEAVIGAVMAGGSASRMGGAKAMLELHGRPLISYPLGAFAEAGIEAVVVAKRDSFLPVLDVPVWHEADEPTHPLLGIVTALEQADGRPVLICGCDMPFVTPDLLSYLAQRDEPLVVPHASGRLQPLIARYDASFLTPLREALEPPRALHDVIAELEPAIVSEQELQGFGEPARLLFNINTPEDLERAEELAF